jgi:ribosomal protein S10
MNNKPTVFLSYADEEENFARNFKTALEKLFPESFVYVAAIDMEGGQLWAEKLKDALKNAVIIIPLLTENSISNPWVLFESGAGFQDDRTIPLLLGTLNPRNLQAPFSYLHSRVLSRDGLSALIKDLTGKLEKTPVGPISTFLREIEEYSGEIKVNQLKKLLPISKFSPSAKQWVYKRNCLVYDYPIEGRYKIFIDVYFLLDRAEIQLHGRDQESVDYLSKKMLKNASRITRKCSPILLPFSNQLHKTINRDIDGESDQKEVDQFIRGADKIRSIGFIKDKTKNQR